MAPTQEVDFSSCPLVEGADEDEICTEQPAPSSIPRKAGSIVVLCGVGLAVGTACLAPFHSADASVASPTSIIGFAAKAIAEQGKENVGSSCSADGDACLESGCCAPGGPKGLQCFKKNDNWASCAQSCEPGVHEPEEEGTWDANGVFQKAQWSCETIGEPSKPGCEAFTNKSKSDCPTDYCTLKGSACVPRCDTYGEQNACWKSKECMWQDDTCMDACWTFDKEHTCKPSSKCVWHQEKCKMGWWLYNSHDSCPQDVGYMWNGSCVPDPCSVEGEDCSKTHCCSMERGASGKTCFKKNKYWATCQDACPGGNWSCEKLGPRANFSSGCDWAGEDCSVNKLCCNRGFVCAVKDETFTGCVLQKSTSTWVSQNVPMPAGWEGTVVGAGRDEFEHPKAGEGDKKIGTSLYCFMAYLPESYEEGLVKLAEEKKASIYGCDKHDLFHTWQSASAGWDTGESTLQNTDVFLKVWEQVQERGDFENYDWTVKVDPDCVFAPQRLKSHIESYNLPDWAAVYIKNNGQDPGLGNNGFLGAIEIFSKKAIQIYNDNAWRCEKALGLQAGEDGFMKGCMDGIGVGFVMDVDIFFPDNGAGACMNAARVAFHPLKAEEKWTRCWDIVLGNVPF